MPGLYHIVTRHPSELITALIYNSDMQAHVDGRTATEIQSYGAALSQFNITTNPYPSAVEDLAPSLAGEIARLRFVIDTLKSALVGGQAVNWYDPMRSPGFLTIGARVRRSTALSIPNNTVTKINFTGATATFNNPTTVWVGGSPTRFTAPFDGFYLAVCSVLWAAAASGKRQLEVAINGTILPAYATPTSFTTGGVSIAQPMTLLLPVKLVATDYVEFLAYQNSGGALNLTSNGDSSIVGGLVFVGSLP